MKKLLLALALVSGFASAGQAPNHVEFDWIKINGTDVVQGDTDHYVYHTLRLNQKGWIAFKSEGALSDETCAAINEHYGDGGADTTVNYETYRNGLYMRCRPDNVAVGAFDKQASLAIIQSIKNTGKVEFQGFEFKSAYRFHLVI